GRAQAVAALVQQRSAARDRTFADFTAKTGTLDGLVAATASCISCYNCRVACPVCYCRQCVFLGETVRQDGDQLVARARSKGTLRLPTDTIFYHLTRMAHVSTLCVGCGQCASACPNDVPVMLLFSTVAAAAQRRFGYLPGADPGETQPLATFREGEFEDATR
ncbi:MAG: formate dehydrogenase, partial [Deltaproteobacteria bacterium]|nr:formate dehydrogenase [Deltaproteobacteria bacterium]